MLELTPPDGYAVIGLYLPDADEGDCTLNNLLLQNGVCLSTKEKFRMYFDELPVVSTPKVTSIMRGLPMYLYGGDPGNALHSINFGGQSPAACPGFREDALDVWADSIQQRYDREQQFLNAVAKMDDSAVNIMGGSRWNGCPTAFATRKTR